jgi:BNR repeat-containing family member
MLKYCELILLASWTCLCSNAATFQLVERLEVGPAWAGCPAGFALATHSNRQFIAYYDENREMTLAQRDLTSTSWQYKRLPSKLRLFKFKPVKDSHK